MKRLRVSRAAVRDLDRIWLHVAREGGSIETANRLVFSITGEFTMLTRNPEAGSARTEIGPLTRVFPIGSYNIYYREERSVIVISRVIHGMRDQIKAWTEP